MKKYIHMSLVALMTVGSVCAMEWSDTNPLEAQLRLKDVTTNNVVNYLNYLYPSTTGQDLLMYASLKTGKNYEKAIYNSQDITNVEMKDLFTKPGDIAKTTPIIQIVPSKQAWSSSMFIIEHLSTGKRAKIDVNSNMTGQDIINLFNKQTGANATRAIFAGQNVTNKKLGDVKSEGELMKMNLIIHLV